MNLNYYHLNVGLKKNQPLTLDMTKDKYQGRYRLALNSIFVPDSSLF